MNGKEQKERRTAVARLERALDRAVEDFQDVWSAEVDSRVKEDAIIREVFTSMVDAETAFRKKQIAEMQSALTTVFIEKIAEISVTVFLFINLPWWKRWGWCLFGAKFLLWTAPAAVRRDFYSSRQPPMPPPPAMSEENQRKQQASSEKPQ